MSDDLVRDSATMHGPASGVVMPIPTIDEDMHVVMITAGVPIPLLGDEPGIAITTVCDHDQLVKYFTNVLLTDSVLGLTGAIEAAASVHRQVTHCTCFDKLLDACEICR